MGKDVLGVLLDVEEDLRKNREEKDELWKVIRTLEGQCARLEGKLIECKCVSSAGQGVTSELKTSNSRIGGNS